MRELLLVDDEVHAVRGLISSVDWETLGIGAVHTAYNIRRAMEVFSRHKIDIVISDIEMPQGDGLEFLSWVRANHPRTVCLFLTCHAEFDYARKAVALGVMAYLLKPARSEELSALMIQAVAKLEESESRETDFQTYRRHFELWSANQPLLIERFWLDLLDRALPAGGPSIEGALSEIDAGFSASATFVPILVALQGPRGAQCGPAGRETELLLKAEARRVIPLDDRRGALLALKRNLLLLLSPAEEAGSAAPRNFAREALSLVDAANAGLGWDLSCYLGQAVPVADIPDAVDRLIALDRNNICARNRVFVSAGSEPAEQEAAAPDLIGWADQLLRGEERSCLAALSESLGAAVRRGRAGSALLEGYRRNLLQVAHFALARKGLSASVLPAALGFDSDDDSRFRSVSGFLERAQALLAAAADAIRAEDARLSPVGKMQAYIGEHIREALTREYLAEAFYVSPDHLTRLFKKETGLSVSDYLIKARVDAAKELLIHSDESIGFIASSLGYGNFSHFSKLFKRETGMTPNDYRKSKRAMPSKRQTMPYSR